MKSKRGGKRPGAGRPKTGRSVVTRSVSMEQEMWDTIDALRGKKSRGKWIVEKIFHKCDKN